MHWSFTRIAVVACCLCGAPMAACTADIHDNAVELDDPQVSFETDADVENVQQGATIPVRIRAANVYPVHPDQEPPPERADEAVYFKIFLDDEESDPLVVTANVDIDVTLPSDVKPGEHELICRVFMHDGRPTTTEFSIDITVKATGAVSGEDTSDDDDDDDGTGGSGPIDVPDAGTGESSVDGGS